MSKIQNTFFKLITNTLYHSLTKIVIFRLFDRKRMRTANETKFHVKILLNFSNKMLNIKSLCVKFEENGNGQNFNLKKLFYRGRMTKSITVIE